MLGHSAPGERAMLSLGSGATALGSVGAGGARRFKVNESIQRKPSVHVDSGTRRYRARFCRGGRARRFKVNETIRPSVPC
jgi:hypothetical protein